MLYIDDYQRATGGFGCAWRTAISTSTRPWTDIRFYDLLNNPRPDIVDAVAARIRAGANCILSVGVGRAFAPQSGRRAASLVPSQRRPPLRRPAVGRQSPLTPSTAPSTRWRTSVPGRRRAYASATRRRWHWSGSGLGAQQRDAFAAVEGLGQRFEPVAVAQHRVEAAAVARPVAVGAVVVEDRGRGRERRASGGTRCPRYVRGCSAGRAGARYPERCPSGRSRTSMSVVTPASRSSPANCSSDLPAEPDRVEGRHTSCVCRAYSMPTMAPCLSRCRTSHAALDEGGRDQEPAMALPRIALRAHQGRALVLGRPDEAVDGLPERVLGGHAVVVGLAVGHQRRVARPAAERGLPLVLDAGLDGRSLDGGGVELRMAAAVRHRPHIDDAGDVGVEEVADEPLDRQVAVPDRQDLDHAPMLARRR